MMPPPDLVGHGQGPSAELAVGARAIACAVEVHQRRRVRADDMAQLLVIRVVSTGRCGPGRGSGPGARAVLPTGPDEYRRTPIPEIGRVSFIAHVTLDFRRERLQRRLRSARTQLLIPDLPLSGLTGRP